MSAQNFTFAPKFPQNEDFQTQILHSLKFLDKIKKFSMGEI